MYSPTLPYYNLYTHRMDMATAYYIQLQKSKEDPVKLPKEKKDYVPPKRNKVCCQCGQQFHWCNCEIQPIQSA